MRIIESRKLTAVLRNVKIINYNSIEETRLRDLSQTIIITTRLFFLSIIISQLF